MYVKWHSTTGRKTLTQNNPISKALNHERLFAEHFMYSHMSLYIAFYFLLLENGG